jgi:iron complex outermembrane recepter protein
VLRISAVTLLVFCLGAASVAVGADVPSPPAAKSDSGREVPTLPETEVIGQPAPSQPGPSAPTTPSAPEPGEGRPVSEGGIFASPKASGYSAPSSTAATMIDVPNLEVPATIDVVTEKVMADQQVVAIDDLLRDVSGAVKVNDDRRPDAFFLRGFLITSRDYRKNGFLDPTYTPRDFANIERVEVLQGPGSVLYGAGQPSGTVNLITKKPLDCSFNDASMEFGSFGFQRYTVDSTGPIDKDGSLLYRINAAYQDTDSFRDFGYQERTFVAPAMTWVIDRDTALTWEGEFSHDRRRYDSGVAAVNGQLVLPISRFLGEPDNDFQRYHDYRQSLVMNHRINDDWSWKLGGYSLFYDSASSATIPVAPATFLGPDDFFRTRQDIGPFREQYQSIIANLSGTVEGPLLTHHLVFGSELGWFTSDRFHAAQSIPTADPSTWLVIDAAAPVYGLVPPNVATPFVFDSTFYQADYGLYFQDLIDLGARWKALCGVRYDHVDTIFNREFQPLFGPTRTEQTFDEGSPRVGLVYELLPKVLSGYGMFSQSFVPPPGLPYANAGPLRPELGQIWEGGFKAQLRDGLTVTAAGYYINKENVTRLLPGGFLAEQIGRQRSQGMELSVVGRVSERLRLLANYAYTDTLLDDPADPAVNGQRALGVPFNTANVWARYNLIQCPHRTLGVGLGVVYVGERLGDYVSPAFTLPDYTRWDAGIYYTYNRLDMSLYFENIFDAHYYTGSISQFEVFPGAPFNLRGQLCYRF